MSQVSTPDRTDVLFDELQSAIRQTSDSRITQILQAIEQEGRKVVLGLDDDSVKETPSPMEPFAFSKDDEEALLELGIKL